MTITTRRLLPLALFALTPAVLGQGTLTPVLTRAFPSPDYKELAFGQIYGNEGPVLAVLDGTTVQLLGEPTVWDGRSTVASVTGVTSVAVQRSSVPGAIEDLLLADASGLVRVRGTYEWGLESPVPLLGGAWQGALELEARDMDGVPVVLGLSAARDQVLCAIDLGGGVWTNGFALQAPVGETILAYAGFDHDADAVMEVAFLTDEDLWVVEQDGTPLLILRSWAGSEGDLARVVDGGGERLAWATRNSAGTPVLKVLNAAGGETPTTLIVPVVENESAQPINIGRMVAGDLDGDGSDDLVLSDEDSRRWLVAYNQGSPTHFTLASLGTDHRLMHNDPANPYASGAGDSAAPVLGSMVGGGTQSVASSINSFSSIVVVPGINPVGSSCTNEPTTFASCFISNASTINYSGNETIVNLAMVLPPQITNNFTHVKVALWVQLTEGGALDSNAVSNQLFPLYYDPAEGQYTAKQWIKLGIPEAQNAENTWGHHQYYVRYRFVTADTTVTPPVIQTSTEKSFVSGIDAGNTTYLFGQQTTGSTWIDCGTVASTPLEPGPGATVGTYIYTDVQPPMVTEPQSGSLLLVPGGGNAPW